MSWEGIGSANVVGDAWSVVLLSEAIAEGSALMCRGGTGSVTLGAFKGAVSGIWLAFFDVNLHSTSASRPGLNATLTSRSCPRIDFLSGSNLGMLQVAPQPGRLHVIMTFFFWTLGRRYFRAWFW